MAVGTTMALILGATALAATAGGTMAYNAAQTKKAEKKASAATDAAAQTAEQKSLMETQEEEKTQASRRALLSESTSGFGPNKNLARSFLTTL